MDTQDLKNVMNNYSGGSDGRTRHPFNRRFIYSEGVKDVFEQAGAYWLSDIIATEVAPICFEQWNHAESAMSFLRIKVEADATVDMWLESDEGEPRLWERKLEFTSFPEGDWTFYMGMDGVVDPASGEVVVMFLPQEN